MRFSSPTDAALGVLLTLIGAGGVYFTSRLSMGSSMRMGPGYFPALVAWILVGFGVLLFVRGFAMTGPAIEGGRLRPILAVLAAVLAFALGIEHLGLFATIVAMVLIAAAGSAESRPLEVAAVALVLAAFSCVLFISLLGLPMRWFPALALVAPAQAPTLLLG